MGVASFAPLGRLGECVGRRSLQTDQKKEHSAADMHHADFKQRIVEKAMLLEVETFLKR